MTKFKLDIPFSIGDKVWTFREKCTVPAKVIICKECGIRHSHEPKFINVPVRAEIQSITMTGCGWTCEVAYKDCSGMFRRPYYIVKTKQEAIEFCRLINKNIHKPEDV